MRKSYIIIVLSVILILFIVLSYIFLLKPYTIQTNITQDYTYDEKILDDIDKIISDIDKQSSNNIYNDIQTINNILDNIDVILNNIDTNLTDTTSDNQVILNSQKQKDLNTTIDKTLEDIKQNYSNIKIIEIE